MIRAFLPFGKFRAMANLAYPGNSRILISEKWLFSLAEIFDRNYLFGKDPSCIVRSLVLFRFLHLSGQKVDLVIGFNEDSGHAWIENNSIAVLEPIDPNKQYRRILKYDSQIGQLVPEI